MLDNLSQALIYLPAMLFALTFHEAAHAGVAYLRGDKTAKYDGRLSLNPSVHADPLGTLLLPFIGLLFQAPIIGWAKPVPVDERNFRNRVFDSFLTAIAGPGMNLILAFLTVFALEAWSKVSGGLPEVASPSGFAVKLGVAFVMVNASLAMFNLLPLPPLDGASIVRLFMSESTYDRYYETVAPIAFFLLLGLAMFGALTWISKLAQLYVGVCSLGAKLILGS